MKLELKEKVSADGRLRGLFEATEIDTDLTAHFGDMSDEPGHVRAFVGMYGAISMKLDYGGYVSCVKLNHYAIKLAGLEYNDMDAMVPLLIDRVNEKHHRLRPKCEHVTFANEPKEA